MTKLLPKLLFAILLFTPIYLPNLEAQSSVIGDYDGDGTSDLSLGLVDRNRRYTAYLTRPTVGENPLFWEWNVAADAFAPGKYFGDGKNYPAIVRVVDINSPLHWHFKRPDGSDLTLLYGFPGDGVPNHGPDFDGDGISDIYVVRNGTPDSFPGFRIWFIAMSKTGTVHQVVFGKTTDEVFGADVTGDGVAELVALRPSTYVWYSANAFVTDVSQINAVQWGLPGDIPLPPQDIDGDGKPDYIISRRNESGIQTAYIRTSEDNVITRPLGLTTSVPVLGKFRPQDQRSDFAWQQRDTGWAAIRNEDGELNLFRHGISTNAIIRPDGTVIQPNQDGRVPSSNAPSSQDPGPTNDAPGCDASPGTKTRFRGDGDLWKPVSESTGNVVILLPSSYTSAQVDILSRDGNVLSRPQRTRCCPNGGRMHFWMDRRASTLAQHAPLTVRVRRGSTTECRIVDNPNRRHE